MFTTVDTHQHALVSVAEALRLLLVSGAESKQGNALQVLN